MSSNADLIARARRTLVDNDIAADEPALVDPYVLNQHIRDYRDVIDDLVDALEQLEQLEPSTQLTRTTYVHPGRLPAFEVTIGQRARDIQSGKEGLVLDIRRDTRYAPWKVAMKLDQDGSTWQFFAHQIVAPKGQ